MQYNKKEGVSKATFAISTPKSPKGDLLKINGFVSPPIFVPFGNIGLI